jgi:Rubisco Assembly chaperone C-terminal domain
MKTRTLFVTHILVLASASQSTFAWIAQGYGGHRSTTGQLVRSFRLQSTSVAASGSLHGQNACFMPLKQLDQDAYTPRIVQIAGSYPGLTRQDYYAVTSEPPAALGQWTYDFSDPDGPQLGTVALEGSNVVASCEDPIVIIAEHFSLGVELPKAITEPVDLIVLVDRAKNRFGERRFLVLDTGEEGIMIAAFGAKSDLPPGAEILGQVDLVQIPWLPSMAPTKTGFLEADEYV